MKYINFLLILSVIFCYAGIGSKIHHSFVLPSIESHHATHQEDHKQEISDTDSMVSYYKNIDATKHKGFKCCYYMLPSAPHSYDFNLVDTFLYSLAVNIPILEINKLSNYSLRLIIREHDPPELFLSNSSLLL
jgi:hypothetical protein